MIKPAVIKITTDLDLGRSTPPEKLPFRVFKLMVGGVILWGFVVFVSPWLGAGSWVSPITRFIEGSGINATAIYYTDLEEFSVAEHMVRDSVTYSAVKKTELSETGD